MRRDTLLAVSITFLIAALGISTPVAQHAKSVTAIKTELDLLRHDLSAALAHEQSNNPVATVHAAQERPVAAKAGPRIGATEEVFVEADAPAGSKR